MSGTRSGFEASAPGGPSSAASSVRDGETEKFASLSGGWWDRNGPFRALHSMNRVRVPFIRDVLCNAHGLDPAKLHTLENVRILDVGCGGGILARALAALGAHVTAIDASAECIAAASAYHERNPAALAASPGRIDFAHATAEQLVDAGAQFDSVVASEVIEHVDTPPSFLHTLARLTRPGGAVVVSTLNRTPESYCKAIVFAERVMDLAPPGTHDWGAFITPEELALMGADAGLHLSHLTGMSYDPFRDMWTLTGSTGVNYVASLLKGPPAA
ncbi:unnamed protein product [Pedinophyceae sp. YPF-701]|nr:unnamed protein product [Pedinophyceae sp. YPF-701]